MRLTLFALILTGVTAAVAFANTYLGHAAVTVGAAMAGFADVHAASSVLSLGAGGMLEMSEMLLAILLAFSTNTFSKIVSKIAAACLSGGRQFATRTGLGLLVIMIATWLRYFLA